ncbi:MAG: hypothetical protein GAK34_00134 [Delftia tsuruhatensis]|nr:MAG: hypothetical protein GAK34_00134 [Delftia tsuruhatensis]
MIDGRRQQRCAAAHDQRQFLGRVELQPRDDAEAVAQRVGQHAGARGRAHQRERLQVQLDGARRRPLADHDVDLVVLQRRVEDFLDHGRQAVDLVDEQHIVGFEVGQQRRQVLGLFQHGAAGLAQVHAQLGRDDVRQRGLAQARRAEQQHMVQRLAALSGRADEDLQLLARLGLAHVLLQQLGAQGALHGLFPARDRRCRNHARLFRCLVGRETALRKAALPEIVGMDAHAPLTWPAPSAPA